MAEEYLAISSASSYDRDLVIARRERCGLVKSYNPPDADFDAAVGGPASDMLVVRSSSVLVGSMLVSYDGH